MAASWQRTHRNGELNKSNVQQNVILTGWVESVRDHGGLIFVDLRDRWGTTQVVFLPEENPSLAENAKHLKMESVIGIKGNVEPRPDNMINPKLATGEIEVHVSEMEVFNESKPLPFLIKDPCDALDETRFRYRYLDLRRPSMQQNILLRHKTAQIVRSYFDKNDFVEVETPFLMKSTPEGARDYLVPSRIHNGKFYALPQSPQTYKQLLMISGFDRYFQIVKCFRDEDLRADRQPEFTQIDVEMSFIDETTIMTMVEGLMERIFSEILDQKLTLPLDKLSYQDAMAKYGNDRPDLRFDLSIQNISQLVASSEFKVFRETVENGNQVRGLCLKGCGRLTRKQTDHYTDFVKKFQAKGLVVIQLTEEGIVSPIAKFVSESLMQKISETFQAQTGDVIFAVADTDQICSDALGNLRVELAKDFNLIDESVFKALWVVDFPLLDYDEDEERYVAMHHPFTSPKPEDIPLLDEDPGKVRARAYDLVLNGSEIAGGSIRIHRRDVQQKMFKALGLDDETAEQKFGFLLQALEYGAPPHGGIAFGFDRLIAMLAGEKSIREVIAFPKTTSALSLMDGCPSDVSKKQLGELGLIRLQAE